MMLTDLVTAVRKAGLPVTVVDGWQTRGHGSMTSVDTIVVHHTATSLKAAGDYPTLGIVRDGRSDLPGPLAQLGLGRDGTIYVIAAGVSYHAGDTFEREEDNWHAIGIEAEHDGLSPWPERMVDAYARLCAALAEHYDIPVSRIRGHKEVAKPLGRKTDPNFDMDAFRARIAAIGDDADMANYADDFETIKRGIDDLKALAVEERKRDRASWRREAALAREVKRLGGDVDKVLAEVQDEP